jgi:ppGpp synthetase/RelA/SpoT-type nucleotidyltranferase
MRARPAWREPTRDRHKHQRNGVSINDADISKSQLDKLGSRLRNSVDPDDEDLVLLNRYRKRFSAVNDTLISELQRLTHFAVESRHKSVPSIVAKLRRRQPARLSAIQDLAGARIIVPDLRAQDELVGKLVGRYPDATIDDKRAHPKFSYRSVHVVVNDPLLYEIQVRTTRQHVWAQLSERLADRYGFELKYGGGPQNVAAALSEYSDFLAAADELIASDPQTFDRDLIGTIRAHLERLPAVMETLKIR